MDECEWVREWVSELVSEWMSEERKWTLNCERYAQYFISNVYLHIVWFDVCWKYVVSVESKNQHRYNCAYIYTIHNYTYTQTYMYILYYVNTFRTRIPISFRHTLNIAMVAYAKRAGTSRHVQNNTKNLSKQQITRTTAETNVCVMCLCHLIRKHFHFSQR